MPTVQEALAQLAGVDKWSRDEKPAFSVNFFAMRPRVRKEPKGTVLIISPFNYPVWLTLGPLVSALSSPFLCRARELSCRGTFFFCRRERWRRGTRRC